jgi:uncharacterized membrane protein (DUF373 family)
MRPPSLGLRHAARPRAVRCDVVSVQHTSRGQSELRADALIRWVILVIEYAIIASLLLVASVVLVRTVVDFLQNWNEFPETVVGAIDGILVVIILLDIAHTVFGHLRASVFPVRPFLVIGILAGVRDILSASARLTLSGTLTQTEFHNTLISLGVGVGVVVFLLLGLLILRYSRQDLPEDVEDSE